MWIDHHDHAPPVRKLLQKGQLLFDVTQLVHHQQYQVSRRQGFTCTANTLGFDRIMSLANAGGIDQVHREPIDLYRFAQYITGGAGYFRDYGAVLPG